MKEQSKHGDFGDRGTGQEGNESSGCSTSNPRPVASADQEVWVVERILAAVRMSIGLAKGVRVGADEVAMRYAIHGVATGVAVEIMDTLGLDCPFINIREIPYGSIG